MTINKTPYSFKGGINTGSIYKKNDVSQITCDDINKIFIEKVDFKGVDNIETFELYGSNEIEKFTQETQIIIEMILRFKKSNNIDSTSINELISIYINGLEESDIELDRAKGKIFRLYIENKYFKKSATIDEKTGLINADNAEKHLDAFVDNFNKYGRVFSILFIDLDKFKEVNDIFGHKFGDSVLKKMGEILQNNLKESDICARWGGEEFLVILDNCDNKDAVDVAEKIRKIAKRELPKALYEAIPITDIQEPFQILIYLKEKIISILPNTNKNCYNIGCKERKVCRGVGKKCIKKKRTCSIGIATIKGKFDDGENTHSILERADKSMFEAKNSGRDKVCNGE